MKTLLQAWNHNAINKIILGFTLLSALVVGCTSIGITQQPKGPTPLGAETIQIPERTNTLKPPTSNPQNTATFEAETIETFACLPAGPIQYGKVLKVVNGATLIIEIDNVRYTVTYIGLNSPKRGGYYYSEAIRKSTQWIFAKKVALISGEIDKDINGALPRYVLYNDVLINSELLKQGYAFLDPEFTEMPCLPAFQSAQQTAQLAKIGVWGGPSTPVVAIIEPTKAIIKPTKIIQPTSAIVPIFKTAAPAPTSGGDSHPCCKVCGPSSQPCGDSCISIKYVCHKAPGCACK